MTEHWQPFETAPRDGTWIMALVNDGTSALRVSWGRAQDGRLAWCSTRASYGDGLFCMWTLAPLLRSLL